jgi:hypothetical protein
VGERFTALGPDRIEVGLFPAERALLQSVVDASSSAMSADSGHAGLSEPGRARLRVPVYLGDEEASEEWWRLMGTQLESAREHDRMIFDSVVSREAPTTVDAAAAEAFLRVVNASRLVLAARLGIEIDEDFSSLTAGDEAILWFLSFIVNDLSEELSEMFPVSTDDGGHE